MANKPTAPLTASEAMDPTLDVVPPSRHPQRATEDAASQSSPHACVALVTGGESEMVCELAALLRARLRLAALVLFAGFAIFLVYSVFVIEFGKVAEAVVFGFHALVVVVLGLVATGLCRRCPIPLGALRACELVIFGLPAAFFLVMQYVLAMEAAAKGYLAFDAGPWLILVFAHALFIPNTLRRAAVMIGVIAAAPVVLMIAIKCLSPTIAPFITPAHLTSFPLLLACAAVASVFGVDTIGTLRREAFEAKQFGQYRLKERLGAGGMGEVYLAEHQLLKRPCVVKLIRPAKAGDPRTIARFQREVRATARLSHWNTIEIYDYGSTTDGTFYYVMEYLPGMSLSELVEEHGPQPPERVIHLLLQACDALGEAHAMGLIHRDIKPGNIFAAIRGGVYDFVKLLDFGLVKPLVDDEAGDITTEGSITGSPLYLSPEQAGGENEADPRSDIYSLGAVGYYLLTGRPPFEGDKMIKLLIAHINEEPRPPSLHRPNTPADLEQVVLRCLAKDPAERFQDAASLYLALSRCEAAGGWNRQRAAAWWQARQTVTPTTFEPARV